MVHILGDMQMTWSFHFILVIVSTIWLGFSVQCMAEDHDGEALLSRTPRPESTSSVSNPLDPYIKGLGSDKYKVRQRSQEQLAKRLDEDLSLETLSYLAKSLEKNLDADQTQRIQSLLKAYTTKHSRLRALTAIYDAAKEDSKLKKRLADVLNDRSLTWTELALELAEYFDKNKPSKESLERRLKEITELSMDKKTLADLDAAYSKLLIKRQNPSNTPKDLDDVKNDLEQLRSKAIKLLSDAAKARGYEVEEQPVPDGDFTRQVSLRLKDTNKKEGVQEFLLEFQPEVVIFTLTGIIPLSDFRKDSAILTHLPDGSSLNDNTKFKSFKLTSSAHLRRLGTTAPEYKYEDYEYRKSNTASTGVSKDMAKVLLRIFPEKKGELVEDLGFRLK